MAVIDIKPKDVIMTLDLKLLLQRSKKQLKPVEKKEVKDDRNDSR
jgi:hypothetical protein